MKQKRYIYKFKDEEGYTSTNDVYAENITQALNQAKKKLKIEFGYIDIVSIEEEY